MNNHKISSQIAIQKLLLDQICSDYSLLEKIERAIEWLYMALSSNHPVLVCGNGGSASDAQHISGELVASFLRQRRPLNVICLNSNTSMMTAWSNDVSFDSIYERQVLAHGHPEGVCWVISTSGNSLNVVNAVLASKKLGMKTIALTGHGGGLLAEISDLILDVPSIITPRVQELHLPIYHYMCEQIESKICADYA